MMISTERASGGGFTTLTVSHKGERVLCTNSTFARTTIHDHKKLFEITNDILSKLSESDQDKVFAIYSEVNTLTGQRDIELTRLIELISGYANKLYALLNLTEMNADGELSLKLNLCLRREYHVPDTLQTTYNETHQRDQTYLRDDYLGLCALAEATRFALPIWLPFMRNRHDEMGTAFKEFNAAGLIYGTDVYKSKQVNTLIRYAEAIIGNTEMPLAARHAGLSSSEAPEYITALALIRKVSIGETQIPAVDLICNVSNHERTLLKQLGKKFETNGRVIETPKPNEGNGDDNTSTAENKRLKEKLPLSRYEETKAFIRRHPEIMVTRVIGSTVSQRLMQECAAAVNRLSKSEINHMSRIKIILAVVRRAGIPPNMIDVLDHEHRKMLMVITAAILVATEKLNVLNLLLAKLTPSEENSIMMGGQLNSAISNDTLLRLNQLYYLDEPEAVNAKARKNNLAHVAIIKIIDDLSQYELEVNIPKRLGESGDPVDLSRPYGEELAEVIYEFDFTNPYTKESKIDNLAAAALEKVKAGQ